MIKRTIGIMAGVLLLGLALLGVGECGYDKIESIRTIESATASIREDYPEVKSVSPKALRLFQQSGDPVLLVDVRTEEEFAVSCIPEAVHFETPGELGEHLLGKVDLPGTVVLYDSLGFRSAEFAEKLQDTMTLRFEHLEGGIFAWANEGLPLTDPEGEPASEVHPYNKMWGRLLDPGLRYPLKENE